MAHWRTNHQTESNLLRHSDLYNEAESDRQGKSVWYTLTVTIEKMTVDVMKSKEKPKGERRNFAHFSGKKKPLGLNVGHCEALEGMSGSPDPKHWKDLKIQLFVDPQARYANGKRGPAIRIAPMRAKGPDTPLPDVSPEVQQRLNEEQDAANREPGEEG